MLLLQPSLVSKIIPINALISVDLHVLSDSGERLVCWRTGWRNGPTGPWWSSKCQAGHMWGAGWHCFAGRGSGGKAEWVSTVPRLQQLTGQYQHKWGQQVTLSPFTSLGDHIHNLLSIWGSPVEMQWCEGGKTATKIQWSTADPRFERNLLVQP